MKVFVSDNRLLLIRDKDTERNYGSFNLENCFDKQVVNDFIINNYKHYGDSVVYDNSVKEYIEKNIYEIEDIDSKSFKITSIKYEIVGYVKLECYSKEEGIDILEYYVANPDDENTVIYNSKLMPAKSELFKECVAHHSDENSFNIRDYRYTVKDFCLFSGRDGSHVLLFGDYNLSDFTIHAINEIYPNVELTYEKVTYVLLNKNGEIKFKDGFVYKEKYYILIENLLDYDDYDFECRIVIARNKKVKRRKLRMINDNPLIDTLYIFDHLSIRYINNYEEVTYIVKNRRDKMIELNGYYLSNRKIYMITKDVIGDYRNYKFRVKIINEVGKEVYNPHKGYIENNLDDKSFLSELGYTVADGVSVNTRRNYLKIGIQEYNKAKVESHLSFLIKLHKNNKNKERFVERWKSDLEWVQINSFNLKSKIKV